MKRSNYLKIMYDVLKNYVLFCCIVLFILFIALMIATVFGVIEQNKLLDYILKFDLSSDVINVLATCISAVAAIFSYCAAKNSADIAKKSLHHAKLKDMLETRDAIRNIWFFLTQKLAISPDGSKLPEKFAITDDEIAFLEEQYFAIHHSSIVYGKELHEKISDFYINLKDELKAQKQLCDMAPDGSKTLFFMTQQDYYNFRKREEKKSFDLNKECVKIIYRYL